MKKKVASLFEYFNAMFEEGLQHRGDKTVEDVFDETIERFENEHDILISCVPGFTSYDTFRNKRRREKRKRFEQSVH